MAIHACVFKVDTGCAVCADDELELGEGELVGIWDEKLNLLCRTCLIRG